MTTTPKYWFKPKSHGYGCSPSTWEGWAVTVAAAVVPSLLGFALLGGANRQQSAGPFALWLILTLAVFVAFWKFARARTDGEWKWRWKGRQYDQK